MNINITKTYGFKALTLIFLTLIMMFPASMVQSLIRERDRRARGIRREIADSVGGPLQFANPVLKVPGERTSQILYEDSSGKTRREYTPTPFSFWYSPQEVQITIALDVENKKRGIVPAPVFRGTLTMKGRFDLNGLKEKGASFGNLDRGHAVFVIPFFNQKVIKGIEMAVLDSQNLRLEPGNRGLNLSSGGIHAEIALPGQKDFLDFEVRIQVRGADFIGILPLADNLGIQLTSNWQAPSFSGLSLPDSHIIDEEGFTASWKVSSLSSGIPGNWVDTLPLDSEYKKYSHTKEAEMERIIAPEDRDLTDFIVGTKLLNVLNNYGLATRAAKYSVLFILIPFIALFLFEIFLWKPVHFIQYMLVGVANIIFYLLLLSLSEYLGFNTSYLIASAAVTLLVALYTFGILKKEKKSWYMAPVMTGAYFYLFMTLQSEDWALLIGSIGVFAITAFIMFITRKINFFRIGEDAGEEFD